LLKNAAFSDNSNKKAEQNQLIKIIPTSKSPLFVKFYNELNENNSDLSNISKVKLTGFGEELN
jgi:hypothetical protein